MTTAVSDRAPDACARNRRGPRRRRARLSLVAQVDAHEGPAYLADEDALYLTTLVRPGTDRSPSVQIKRLPLERRGPPFNSPNDLVVASDGAIWFTDPAYGHLQGFRPEPQVGDFVYRHDPATGQTTVVADGFDKPNEIALPRRAHAVRHGQRCQPGGRQLLRRPAPSHQGVRPPGRTASLWRTALGRHLTRIPDGLKVDDDGRVYGSSCSGVQVLSPAANCSARSAYLAP